VWGLPCLEFESFADAISNSPLFVVMSFVLFSHSIVNFLASLIKASYYYVTQEIRSPAGIKESSLRVKLIIIFRSVQ
jgi:hypothetical protein